MILFVLAVLIFGSLALMGVVIRDIGNEINGMGESSKTTEERKNAKIREELGRRRAGEETISAQERMADRKLTKEIERWREES